MLPIKVIEDTYRAVLPRYGSFMRDQLGIKPPYTLEAGAVGLDGVTLVVTLPDETSGPIHDGVLRHRVRFRSRPCSPSLRPCLTLPVILGWGIY